VKTAPPGLPPPHWRLPFLQALLADEPGVTVKKLVRAMRMLTIIIIEV
jgi:hypothetical protein